MAEQSFREPRLALNRIYTRRGDEGQTSLVNGRRVRKDDARVEAYGTVDELNAFVGRALEDLSVARQRHPVLTSLSEILRRIQHELFNLGSEIATDPEKLGENQPRVVESQITKLEGEIDSMNAELEPLRSFVLPGGSALNVDLHLCRVVCRRAERRVIAATGSGSGDDLRLPSQYLNRLSDAFFVFSRWASLCTGDPETVWEPNLGA